MSINLEEFINKIPSFGDLTPQEKIDYFIYYLTIKKNKPGTRPTEIGYCFDELHLVRPSNISKYIIDNLKKPKDRKFIRVKGLYLLEKKRRDEIEKIIKQNRYSIKTEKSLRDLVPQISISSEKDFLDEAIECFEVGAFRAAVIMAWILTIQHLFEYIFNNYLDEFNKGLAKVTDKRVKVTKIKIIDDFSDIPEGKFIELCRSCGAISNDVRKILEQKLGIRNSSGHPSAVKISEIKAIDFLEDLIINIILKY